MKKLYPIVALFCVLILWGCPQKGEDPVLTPIQTTYSIDASGGDFKISFKTNQDYSIKSGASWLKVAATKAVRTETVTITAEPNTSDKSRSGNLTISAGTLSATITVEQEGTPAAEDPYINISKDSYSIAAAGGNVTVSVSSNVDYKTSVDASWVKAGSNGVFVVEENTGSEARTATVTFSYESISKSITITQAAAEQEEDVLENGGAATYNVAYTGGTITVTVRSNVDYEVAISADWITQTKTKAVREDKLSFQVAENTGDARDAVISFTYAGELTFSVTVHQNKYVEPGEEPYMELSTHDVSISGDGGDYLLTVKANYDYLAECDDPWVKITSDGENCILTITKNPDEDIRTTQVMFSSEGLVDFLNLTQAGTVGGDPFDVGSDLSANGTANCYVVTKAGDFSFDASVMGNGPKGFIWEDSAAEDQLLWPTRIEDVSFTNYAADGPSKVSVLWDDNNVITNLSIEDLRISFTATGNKGNALIAAYDRSNLLLWSWHIWCTDSPNRMRHQTVNDERIVMLDRNLGAVSTVPSDGEKTYGYWYQFGRKDPLKLYYNVVGSMVDGELSMEASVEHPTTIYKFVGKDNEWFNGSVSTITADLWGNPYALHNGADHMYRATMDELRKTIYDPCPPGYMVPPEWAWETFTMDDCTVSEYGITFMEENGESFYPFAGYGDQGDVYGGDNGWYGWPGYSPNSDGSKYHHNERNVVACWTSGSEHAYRRSGSDWDYGNYHHANIFMYRQVEEDNTVKVNENSPAILYAAYGQTFSHVRCRSCSVRCMKIQ